MTKTTSRHLLDILAEVPDFRNKRGKRHSLSAILGLAVIAMMCGCRSYTAIAEWGRTYHPDLAKALGFTHTKTPCTATLHYVFKDLEVFHRLGKRPLSVGSRYLNRLVQFATPTNITQSP